MRPAGDGVVHTLNSEFDIGFHWKKPTSPPLKNTKSGASSAPPGPSPQSQASVSSPGGTPEFCGDVIWSMDVNGNPTSTTPFRLFTASKTEPFSTSSASVWSGRTDIYKENMAIYPLSLSMALISLIHPYFDDSWMSQPP